MPNDPRPLPSRVGVVSGVNVGKEVIVCWIGESTSLLREFSSGICVLGLVIVGVEEWVTVGGKLFSTGVDAGEFSTLQLHKTNRKNSKIPKRRFFILYFG